MNRMYNKDRSDAGGFVMNEKKKKNETWEWIKALLIAFGLAAIIRIFLFTPIVVDGDFNDADT